MFLKFFYPRMNKPNIDNTIIELFNFLPFRSNSLNFKSKIIEGSRKVGKICFLTFGHFFSKCSYFML